MRFYKKSTTHSYILSCYLYYRILIVIAVAAGEKKDFSGLIVLIKSCLTIFYISIETAMKLHMIQLVEVFSGRRRIHITYDSNYYLTIVYISIEKAIKLHMIQLVEVSSGRRRIYNEMISAREQYS